jgi:Cu/Ag efflux pump CusA
MCKLVSDISHKLREVPGIKNVSAQIGRAVTSDQTADISSAELWVTINPSVDHQATLAAIHKVVDSSEFDLVDRDVNTYLADRISEEVQGEDRGLVVRVYGENMKTIEKLAQDVVTRLKTTDGVSNPKIEAPSKQPRIEIEPNLEKCRTYGIKPGDVRRTAAILLSGLGVGSLFDEQKVFEVVVWGKPEIRKDLDSVRNLLIEIPDKSPVPLKDLADVRLGDGPTVINREAVARYIDVTADLRGRDLAAIGRDVEKSLARMHFPLEYRAELLGAPAEQLANQQTVLAYAIAALIGIYLLLQVACNSWRVAALVLLMLPLALVGGLAAAYATGGVISYGSLLGLIALLAIATRNFVLLVRRYQQLGPQTGGTVDPELAPFSSQQTPLNDIGGCNHISPELVIAGTRQRFVPLLVTTVAVLAACAPLAFANNVAGLEILRPMAIVVLGGLVTTTLVSLYVLPALYLWLNSEPLPDIVTEPIPAAEMMQPATATS